MKINIANPNIGEAEAKAVYNVVKSGWLNEGSVVNKFEKKFSEYSGAKYCIAVFNGTCALHLMLHANDIGAGDEVIVPSFTFVSTVTSVMHVGAVPVFADIEDRNYCISIDSIEKVIRNHYRTLKSGLKNKKSGRYLKAIIAVHYAGHPADMDKINSLAKKYGLIVIEDAAEAHGSVYRGRSAGRLGNIAMFSFTPTKNITTGEGGMITTDNKNIAEKIRLLKNHGSAKLYHHVVVGYNYRMTEMQAAIGLEQLKKLDRIINRKRANADLMRKYMDGIKGIILPNEAQGCLHTYMMYSIRVNSDVYGIDRNQLKLILENCGVQTKVYFPPVHKQPIFSSKNISEHMNVTERVADEILSIPFYSTIKKKELKYIADIIRQNNC